MSRRRLKIPVLGRLTLAWGTLALGLAGLAAFVSINSSPTGPRIAVAITGPSERLAPPEIDAALERLAVEDVTRESGLATRGSRPALQPMFAGGESVSDASGEEGDRFAPAFDEEFTDVADAYSADADADGIVITIDGVTARPSSEERLAGASAGGTSRAAARAVTLAAVDAALLQKSAYGMIPRRGPDGARAADRYARPFASGGQPYVSIIVGGLGLNRALTERAIDRLPPEVTLAFAPYAKDLPYWTARARTAGHEVMLELPMEHGSGDASALGAAALRTDRSPSENAERLQWLMARFEGYFGATNYLGSKFAADRSSIQGVLSDLAAAGVAYIDDTGVASVSVGRADGAAQADFGAVNRLIAPSYDAIRPETKADLDSLEALARRNGRALGKTYAYTATIDAIEQWAAGLDERGLLLGPASAHLRATSAASR